MLRPLVEGGLLIHGDDDGLAPGALHAFEQRAALVEAAPRVELEPRRSARRGGDLLRRLAGVVADDEGRLRGGRRLVHAHFAVRVQRHLQRRRSHEQGEVEAQPEHGRARVDGGGVNRRARDDIDPAEGVAVAADRELRIGAVRGVVVDGLRDVGVEHRLEVEDRGHLGEAGNAPMVAERPGIALGREQRRPGDECRQARRARRAGSDFAATAVRSAPRSPPAWADLVRFAPVPAGRLRRGTTLRRRDGRSQREVEAACPRDDGRANMREIFGGARNSRVAQRPSRQFTERNP